MTSRQLDHSYAAAAAASCWLLQQQPTHCALHEPGGQRVPLSLSNVPVAGQLLHHRLVHRVAQRGTSQRLQDRLPDGGLRHQRAQGLSGGVEINQSISGLFQMLD